MFRSLIAVSLVISPAIAVAQSRDTQTVAARATPAGQAEIGQPPQRVRNIQLRPGEACPPSSKDDVVVCGTLSEPYRIPKALRDDGPIPAQNQSWAARTEVAEQIGRVAGGLPDTCSTVGSGGQTGCALQANKNWVAAKAEERRQASSVP